MSKFNVKRKKVRPRKHLMETNENHKIPNRTMVAQLEIYKIVSRGSKYIKKLQSNVKKIMGNE